MTMNLDVYTQHIPLTQKARFWGNWVSALKGGKDMCAAPEPHIRHFYPSIVETMPGADSRLKNEFGRLEARVLYVSLLESFLHQIGAPRHRFILSSVYQMTMSRAVGPDVEV